MGQTQAPSPLKVSQTVTDGNHYTGGLLRTDAIEHESFQS